MKNFKEIISMVIRKGQEKITNAKSEKEAFDYTEELITILVLCHKAGSVLDKENKKSLKS